MKNRLKKIRRNTFLGYVIFITSLAIFVIISKMSLIEKALVLIVLHLNAILIYVEKLLQVNKYRK